MHPGSSYVLVRREGPEEAVAEHFLRLNLTCTGVEAFRVDVPLAVDPDYVRSLAASGIALSSNLDMWPAGICAAAWEGSNRAGALAGEPFWLGLRCEEAIASMSILVNTVASPPGEPAL